MLKKQVGGNNETICALKDVNGSQALPPVGFIIIIIVIIIIITIIVIIQRELRIDVDHTQGECVCELWRRHRRADLESRGPKTSLGPPISKAWLLLGLCFEYGHLYYQYSGYFFNIPLAARNVYDLTGDNVRFEVEVVDPIVDNMGMEVSMM